MANKNIIKQKSLYFPCPHSTARPLSDFQSPQTPILQPKLTFGLQAAKNGFIGGLYSAGVIRFNLNSIEMVKLARAAFQQYSTHKNEAGAEDRFLFCLATTSAFEGGFDAVNAYDKAGISLGFLQFARPEGGAGKLLQLAGRADLATTIRTRFGTTDPHSSATAMIARSDKALMVELVKAISTPDGIKAQMAMAINQNVDGQLYFDKAYARAKTLGLKSEDCCAMLFDAAVNMGAGSVSKFIAPVPPATEGDWMHASCAHFSRPERKTGWEAIVKKTFA